MALDVVKEIKDAEALAENLRKQALSRSRETIKSAEEQSAKELDAAADEAKRLAEEIIKAKEEEGRNEADAILKSAESECESIRNISSDIADKAVNLVIERIVRSYGNS